MRKDYFFLFSLIWIIILFIWLIISLFELIVQLLVGFCWASDPKLEQAIPKLNSDFFQSTLLRLDRKRSHKKKLCICIVLLWEKGFSLVALDRKIFLTVKMRENSYFWLARLGHFLNTKSRIELFVEVRWEAFFQEYCNLLRDIHPATYCCMSTFESVFNSFFNEDWFKGGNQFPKSS